MKQNLSKTEKMLKLESLTDVQQATRDGDGTQFRLGEYAIYNYRTGKFRKVEK